MTLQHIFVVFTNQLATLSHFQDFSIINFLTYSFSFHFFLLFSLFILTSYSISHPFLYLCLFLFYHTVFPNLIVLLCFFHFSASPFSLLSFSLYFLSFFCRMPLIFFCLLFSPFLLFPSLLSASLICAFSIYKPASTTFYIAITFYNHISPSCFTDFFHLFSLFPSSTLFPNVLPLLLTLSLHLSHCLLFFTLYL